MQMSPTWFAQTVTQELEPSARAATLQFMQNLVTLIERGYGKPIAQVLNENSAHGDLWCHDPMPIWSDQA